MNVLEVCKYVTDLFNANNCDASDDEFGQLDFVCDAKTQMSNYHDAIF